MRTRKTIQIVGVSTAALLVWQSPAFAPPKVKVGHFKLPEFHVPEVHPDLHLNAPDLNLNVPDLHLNAPDVHLNAPDVHLNAPDVHVDAPDVRLNAPDAAPHLDVGNIDTPHLNYEQLPPNPTVYEQLPADARPQLNYGVLQPEGQNKIIGKLPPAYDKVPDLPAVPDRRPLPATPGNNPVGKLPSANYGALPSDPPITAAKPFKPADALGDLVGLPADHPGRVQANKITANVGVPTPVARAPARLPAPQVLAEAVAAAPLQAPSAIKQGMKLSTKIMIGAAVTTVGLVGIGISMPAIVKEITGEDLPSSGDPTVDSVVKALTPP
jgi:hypothetical protein